MEDLNFLELVFVAAALSTIITVPLFLIVVTITGLGRRWLAPWARQALWSLVLVRLLLPVSFGSPASLQPTAIWLFESVCSSMEPAPAIQDAYYIPPFELEARRERVWVNRVEAYPMVPAFVLNPEFDWFEFTLSVVLPCILLAGMLLVAVWTVITTVRLRRLVRAGTDCLREDWLALLTEGREEFRIRRTVTLRTLPALTSPATCGVWRPAILLPEDADQWSSTELRHVVWHELAHIRRFDVATNWALAVVRVLHWWNPLFWYAQRAWLAEREMACDALVLRHLEGHQAGEYGGTILRFLERLSAGHRGLPTSAAPGFVLFLGRKQAVRRRIAQIAKQTCRVPVWRRLLTGGLIAALGLAGLTDAAVPTTPARLPTPDTSPIETRWKVDLPAGTSWKVVTPNQPSAEEVRRVVVYDLTATIARIRQDVPQLAETAVAAEIRQFLRPLLGLPFTESESQSDETRQERSHLELDGVRLIVSATAAQHVEVEQLIRRWAEHGQRQICHEVRFLVASDSLKDLIVGDGGQVLNFGASAENPLDRTPLERLASPLPQSLHRVPVFTRILAPHEAWAFEAGVARVSPTGPGTVTYGPKITAFEGTKSFMSDAVERSYVTGHRTRSDGSLEPQISKVMDGLSLQMKSLIAADGRSTQLRFQWQHSEVTDVEVLEMHGSGQETTIQIPHVSQTADSVAATIPDGHSLLIAPLRRNKQGQLMMFLVRPRVLTAEELK